MTIAQSTLLKFRAKRLHAAGNSVAVGRSETTVYDWLKDMHIDVGSNKGVSKETEQQTDSSRLSDAKYDKYTDGTFQERLAAGKSLAASDTYFRVICALYWGEGRLGNFSDEAIKEVSLASSDPAMVKLWVSWLLQMKVTNLNEIRVHASMNAEMSDNELKQHWASILRAVGYSGDIKIKRLEQMVTSATARRRQGSAYATVYSSYLRGLIIGGITYIKGLYSK